MISPLPGCVRVAATLDLAGRIAAGTTRIEDLAAATGSDAHALHAVLGHLVDSGVFEEPEPGRFALNDLASELHESSPFLRLDGIGGRFAHAWSTLLGYARTGRPGYAEMFGRAFWDDLAAHPDLAADFDALMGPAGHGTPDVFEIDGGWASVATVADVGGGTGAMLAEILRAHPHIQGTLVDLPRTVAGAAAVLEQADVEGRVRVAGQSFFDPLPAGADVYLLRKVLNDWPEGETVAILRRCSEAARPGGRVVVIGGVAEEAAPPRLTIEMVLLGARTNTLGEFRGLARRAGLEVSRAETQASGRFVVECRPF